MVHRRELNGRTLTFGNEGALYGNAMTWWDHETGSLWTQPLAEALVGELKGQRLELYPSTLTSWEDWQAIHPGTLALEIDTPLRRSGFDLDSMMVAVELGTAALAFPVPDLRVQGVINADVGGVPVAVVMQGESWAVFNRVSLDQTLELELTGGLLRDAASGRTWDPFLGFSTNADVPQLALIPAFTVFPRDFSTFWPNGSVWDSDQ